MPIDNAASPLLKDFEDNTVHIFENEWWFWDEVGADRHGPYTTIQDAIRGLYAYCETL